MFLDLEWIFARLSNDISLQYYQTNEHPWRKRRNDFLLDRLSANSRILDLGCGKGELTSSIAANAGFTLGIDRSEELIAIAKANRNSDRVDFRCMDISDYVHSMNEKFDVLVLSHILEHLDEPTELLQQVKGSFRYIYVEVPDFDSSLLSHYRKDLNLQLNYNDADHVSEFDRAEMNEMFEKCNLEVQEAEYILGVQRYWCVNRDLR